MPFKKTGDVLQVQTIFCSCGGEIDKATNKCLKCGKDFSQPESKPAENK